MAPLSRLPLVREAIGRDGPIRTRALPPALAIAMDPDEAAGLLPLPVRVHAEDAPRDPEAPPASRLLLSWGPPPDIDALGRGRVAPGTLVVLHHEWAEDGPNDCVTVALASPHGFEPLSAATADAVLGYTRPQDPREHAAVRATRAQLQDRIASTQAAAMDRHASEDLTEDALREIATVRRLRDTYATSRLARMGSDPLSADTMSVMELTSRAPQRTWDQPAAAWVADALGPEAASRFQECDPLPDWQLSAGTPTPLAVVWTSIRPTPGGEREPDHRVIMSHHAGPVSMFMSATLDDPAVPGRRWLKQNIYADSPGEGVLIGQVPTAGAQIPRPIDEPPRILLPYIATPTGGRLGSLRTAATILAHGRPNNRTAAAREAVDATQQRIETAAPLPAMTALERAEEAAIRARHAQHEARRAAYQERVAALQRQREAGNVRLKAALETVVDHAPTGPTHEPPRPPTLPKRGSLGKSTAL